MNMDWKSARKSVIVASAGLIATGFVGVYATQLGPRSLRGFEPFAVAAAVSGAILLMLTLVVGSMAPIWRDSWRSQNMQDPVQGKAIVVSVSMPAPNSTFQNYRMTCLVSAPGLEATTVEHEGMVRTTQYPSPGATLPVTVDRADPTRLKISWNEVPTGRERGLAAAQELASQMRTGVPASFGGFSEGSRIIIQGKPVDTSRIPNFDETFAQLMLQHGQDPAGLKAAIHELLVKNGLPGLPESSLRGASPTERLNEIEGLHAKGLLTDEEYAEKRKKIVDAI